jgi:acetyltransferase
MISFVDAFAMTTSATIAGPRRAAGNVGVVSQSGGAGQVNVMWRAQEAGVGISYQVSCGNSADLNIIDFIEFMLDDQATDVIMTLVEHIPDGRRFMETARRAASLGKPIVMVKLGRTEAGGHAAASHTGAMAGSDDVVDAALKQCGVIRVDDCNELYEMAMLLRAKRIPRGARAAATTISGGNGVLLVDHGAANGISWPEYSTETRATLASFLPKMATTANPTDVSNALIGKADLFRRCIETIANDENIDIVVPTYTMTPRADLEAAVEAWRATAKPMAMLWIGKCNDQAGFTHLTVAATGMPVFHNTLACVKAIEAAINYGRFVGANAQRAKPARPAGIDVEAARALVKKAAGTMTERASKQVLAAYGFPVTRETLAKDAAEAARIAGEIGGDVALKIESADIPHKTEAGAIRLNVRGDAEVREAFDAGFVGIEYRNLIPRIVEIAHKRYRARR